MKFEEAIKLLRKGKKVRRGIWHKGLRLYAKESGLIRYDNNEGEEGGCDWLVDLDHLEAEDWEEYVEEDNWNLISRGSIKWNEYHQAYAEFDIKKLQEKILEDIDKLKDDDMCEKDRFNRMRVKQIIRKRIGV